jgi:hypothetical protein
VLQHSRLGSSSPCCSRASQQARTEGTGLSGKFTHAGTVTPVEVKALPDGVVTLTAQPHRTGQRQVTATFEVAFARSGLDELSGTYKVVTQLGVVMQGQSYPLSLQDRRPRKKTP